jgi:hypothetical protein
VHHQGELRNKLLFAVLNWWVYVIKYPIIPGCPDAPSHKDYDFHEEAYPKLLPDYTKDLWHWSSRNIGNTNWLPSEDKVSHSFFLLQNAKGHKYSYPEPYFSSWADLLWWSCPWTGTKKILYLSFGTQNSRAT